MLPQSSTEDVILIMLSECHFSIQVEAVQQFLAHLLVNLWHRQELRRQRLSVPAAALPTAAAAAAAAAGVGEGREHQGFSRQREELLMHRLGFGIAQQHPVCQILADLLAMFDYQSTISADKTEISVLRMSTLWRVCQDKRLTSDELLFWKLLGPFVEQGHFLVLTDEQGDQHLISFTGQECLYETIRRRRDYWEAREEGEYYGADIPPEVAP